MTAMDMARDERADLADLLDTLTPEQWYGPTLCDEWRVRDVVAHVIGYEELGMGGLAVRVARGLRSGDVHGSRVAELSGLDTDDLVAMVRRNRESRSSPPGRGDPGRTNVAPVRMSGTDATSVGPGSGVSR